MDNVIHNFRQTKLCEPRSFFNKQALGDVLNEDIQDRIGNKYM